MSAMSTSPPHSRRRFLASSLSLAAGAAFLSRTATAAPAGKRVGFVDRNLENYHANVFLQAMRGPLAARGYTVAGATGTEAEPSRAWAQKNQVPYFEDVAGLAGTVDFFMVLAPSTPGAHLELCQRVLPFKKPTYVDKTFAPDLATAQKIFALADEMGAPVQTTSALRYTNVQEEVRKLAPAGVEHMITWGGGGSYDEYAIHPLELLVSVLGHEATRIHRRGTPERSQLLIDFSGSRTGVVNVYPKSSTPFAASFTTGAGTKYVEVDAGKIFEGNLAAILDFFDSGKPNVDRRESLTLMRLLDASRAPEALQGFVTLG